MAPAEAAKPRIETTGLTSWYAEVPAVKNATVQFAPNQVRFVFRAQRRRFNFDYHPILYRLGVRHFNQTSLPLTKYDSLFHNACTLQSSIHE